MTIRLSEKTMYTTVKITVEKSGYNEIGTGFIFKYFRNEKDSIPVRVSLSAAEYESSTEIDLSATHDTPHLKIVYMCYGRRGQV